MDLLLHRLVMVGVAAVVSAPVLWFFSWLSDRQFRRSLWNRTLGPQLAACDAEEAERERERMAYEATRTHWTAKDSGWDWKHGTESPMTLSVPDQPWNFWRMWQGIVHSSARTELAARNAAHEARLRANRNMFRRAVGG